MLDQQPVLRVCGTHECERAFELLATQKDAEFALREPCADQALRLSAVMEPDLAVLVGRIGTAIPDDHLACAVLLRRDDALERGIVERVILDVDRHPFFGGIERWPLRHSP